MPVVTGVRTETSSDRTHEHIKGVCRANGSYSSRDEVVAAIDRGETWKTSAGGTFATIKKVRFCPVPKCILSPYITTAPDHTPENNLDNLPRC
jgi:Protein of unknown function (DUF3892)